ncbi:MAG: MaoC family dehydratase N-terminal domain-containing protein [Chloroflexi bacterium]|nr:MaoC family dehydratase N-terminal domain-containing protein [Chloroflexota bacterium]
MADEIPITPEMLRFTGATISTSALNVEQGHIGAFARAVGDPNPLWSNEKEARDGRYGGIVAPPTFLRALHAEPLTLPFDVPGDHLLDAGSEWEYFRPVHHGDRIVATTRLKELEQRTGRLGPMLFVVSEITYTNQLDQVVAVQQSTFIRY